MVCQPTDGTEPYDIAYGGVSLHELHSVEDGGGAFDLILHDETGSVEMGQMTVILGGAETVQDILGEK